MDDNLPQSLEFLALNMNRFTSCPIVSHLSNLDHIDLSHIKIKTVPLVWLSNGIQSVDLSFDDLKDYSFIFALEKLLKLLNVCVMGNPVAFAHSYRSACIATWKNVKYLDDIQVTKPERIKALSDKIFEMPHAVRFAFSQIMLNILKSEECITESEDEDKPEDQEFVYLRISHYSTESYPRADVINWRHFHKLSHQYCITG